MSIQMKAKWLLYYVKKNNNQGNIVITFLILLFILGILAAIALPSFMPRANKHKGRQAEAKQYVSSVNKGQQAYYVEEKTFVTTSDDAGWSSLGVGIKTQTSNYKYTIQGDSKKVSVLATPIKKKLRSYSGGVVLVETGKDKTTLAIVCESKKVGEPPQEIKMVNNQPACDDKMRAINK